MFTIGAALAHIWYAFWFGCVLLLAVTILPMLLAAVAGVAVIVWALGVMAFEAITGREVTAAWYGGRAK